MRARSSRYASHRRFGLALERRQRVGLGAIESLVHRCDALLGNAAEVALADLRRALGAMHVLDLADAGRVPLVAREREAPLGMAVLGREQALSDEPQGEAAAE